MDVVAYQGEAGAFSEEGALALFPEAERVAFPSVRKVFEAVEVGRVAAGLVPLDNSQAGSINETYDLFLRHGLHLVAEAVVRVDHCLLALPGSSADDLTEVMSHPQAIAQCEEFLSALEVTVRAEYNTAGAAKRIAEQRLESVGAIASRSAFRRIPTTTRVSVCCRGARNRSASPTRPRSSSVSVTSPARCTAASERSRSVI